MIKKFSEWIKVKEKLHNIEENKVPFFKEGEIWWCGIGDNIGSEVNGKSKYFSRPVYILKKFSKDMFFGIALTSKVKEGSWFVRINFLHNNQTVTLHQARNFNTRRLYTLMGQCDEETVEKIKLASASFILISLFRRKGRGLFPNCTLMLSKNLKVSNQRYSQFHAMITLCKHLSMQTYSSS